MHQGFIQSPRVAIVDILQGGIVFESGASQPAGGASVVPFGYLPVDEQAEAFLEAEGIDIGHGHLLGEGGSHTGAFQGVEFVQGGMYQHSALLLWISGSRMGHGYCRGHQVRPPRSARRGVAGPGRGGGWIRYFCNCGCPG